MSVSMKQWSIDTMALRTSYAASAAVSFFFILPPVPLTLHRGLAPSGAWSLAFCLTPISTTVKSPLNLNSHHNFLVM